MKNARGISLIELMIGISVSSVVALSLGKIYVNHLEIAGTIETKRQISQGVDEYIRNLTYAIRRRNLQANSLEVVSVGTCPKLIIRQTNRDGKVDRVRKIEYETRFDSTQQAKPSVYASLTEQEGFIDGTTSSVSIARNSQQESVCFRVGASGHELEADIEIDYLAMGQKRTFVRHVVIPVHERAEKIEILPPSVKVASEH